MSYHTLQRLTVRLLFDPEFVETVYSMPDQALAGLDLTSQERDQLLATDPRAWGYDQLRRRRTLRTLAEEFKVSTTLALAETRSLASLERFFSSSFFHTSVQNRESMGLAYSQFLSDAFQKGTLKAPQFPDVLRLETTLAKCRRELPQTETLHSIQVPASIDDTALIRLAPAYSVGRFQGNVISTIQKVEQYLFEVNLMPAMVLCDDAPRLPTLPPVNTKQSLYLQFSPGSAGISLVHLDRMEYLVLFEAKKTTSIRSVIQRVHSSGIQQKKALEILAEFLEQKILILSEIQGS